MEAGRHGSAFHPCRLVQLEGAAHEWDDAALEVGVGVVVLLGLGAAWRLRQREGWRKRSRRGCGRAAAG